MKSMLHQPNDKELKFFEAFPVPPKVPALPPEFRLIKQACFNGVTSSKTSDRKLFVFFIEIFEVLGNFS